MSKVLLQTFMTPVAKPVLLTNEYPNFNSGKGLTNPIWEMTSGSLYQLGDYGYSGVPDVGDPGIDSAIHNDSAIFRLTTKETDFLNFETSFLLNVMDFTSTPNTAAVAWDGIHIFLRYQTQETLYYASIARRDGRVVIKKKVSTKLLDQQGIKWDPNEESNGGIYYELIPEKAVGSFTIGTDTRVKASIQTQANGSVLINLYSRGVLVASAVDNGTQGGKAILTAGKTGIRGDNCEFKFKEFVVDQP